MCVVLIVEDDENQRLLAEEVLEEEGYSVASASSGQEALTLASMTSPDLVVLDIHMPGMDGVELLGKLLAINNQLPVIIHTAYDAYKDNFMSWSAGAYVTKRSDFAELKAAVRQALPKCKCSLAAEAALC